MADHNGDLYFATLRDRGNLDGLGQNKRGMVAAVGSEMAG